MNHRTEQDEEIRRFLKKLARREAMQHSVMLVAVYGLAGAVLSFLLNLFSIWFPVYHADLYGWGILVGALVLAGVHILLTYPGEKEAARYGDRAGLEERLSTSLEKRGEEDALSCLQREDTLERIREFPMKLRLPIRVPWKGYLWLMGILCGAMFCALLPSAAKEEAVTKHQLAQIQKEEQKKIQETIHQLSEKLDSGKLTKAETAKMKKLLEEAKTELAEAGTATEVKKTGERLENKIISQAQEGLSREMAKSLQPLVSETDLETLEKYRQKLQELSEQSKAVAAAHEELQSLGEILDQEKKQELIQELEKAAQEGEISSSDLSRTLESLQDANADYANASIQAQGEGSSESDSDSGNSSESDSGSNSSSAESNSGNGDNSGSGNGTGSGSGNGSATGGGSNRGSQEGIERADQSGKAENVWIPDEAIGDDDNLTGKKTGKASRKTKSDQSITKAGKKQELDTVSGEYTQKAYSRLRDGEIPDSMQELVKKYFSELNQ